MGLDGVEIVMAIEDAFAIRINDKEAERCVTPRDIIDLVMSKVQLSDEHVCLSQRSFHTLRRTFIERGIRRSRFRSSTSLDEIVPKQNRRHAWKSISEEIGTTTWPSLERPGWLEIINWSCATVFAFWILANTGFSNSSAVVFATWLAAFFAAAGVCCFLTRPFASSLPKSHSTVAELVSFLVSHNHQLLKADQKRRSREQVAAVVREIVVEHLYCDNYREEARFVEDLGLS